ncbi:hypothetical protein FPQ18DRAFT_398685 [Pyronema domesticum]|uniref:FACT complex subunit POB3 n=1 Tax=Pyronema omphalodes (strain CBS 100304) TaxID=1076935 RepID=U4LLV9_PYROM|nr:hypothetical protein FPQ18DRAFT_398685 [Pyronema domesticum]CCX32923.1 Similar to FACT complex subunit pob3; acc. no. Q4WGK6 [Pyronema omphalodes CBS 100304]
MAGDYETFEGIYLDLSRQPGKCRFAASGMGWKPSGGDTWTLTNTEISSAQWSRAAKGYEVKIITRTLGIVQLDGFEQDDFDRAKEAMKAYYKVNLEHREHALKGWNWGKAEFSKSELHFNVANKPAFEIPFSEVSNSNLAGKNEIAVEFSTGDGTTNGKKKKNSAAVDQLVEMRFYVPGTVKKGEGEDGASDAEGEEMSAATLFYDTLKEKADIGEIAGDTFATFLDILFLTPRGRYDIDMYESSFRLRGKTYDYKIQFENVKKFFLLPKPDEVHHMIVIGLEPPLRQGQTKYPFLVMQFKREEDMDFDLNITEETLKEKYDGKLQMHYENPAYQVVSQIFKGLTGRKVTTPSKDFVSHHQQSGVKCSLKANEGHLFFLDKAFLFVPKPAVYVPFDRVSHVTLSRVGGSVSASRTFDVTVTLKGGEGEHQFNNINREEQASLEDFFKSKNLKIKNDLVDDSSNLLAAALDEEMDDDDDVAGPRADRGSADEDEESVDEDFQADSESDVAEEYDSAHESSGSDDEEDGGAPDDDDDDDDMEEAPDVEEPAKKKVKTKK